MLIRVLVGLEFATATPKRLAWLEQDPGHFLFFMRGAWMANRAVGDSRYHSATEQCLTRDPFSFRLSEDEHQS